MTSSRPSTISRGFTGPEPQHACSSRSGRFASAATVPGAEQPTCAQRLRRLAETWSSSFRSGFLCGHPLTGVGRFPIWPAAQQALQRARPSTVGDVHNHA